MIRAFILLTLFFRPIYSELALLFSLLFILLILLLSSLSVFDKNFKINEKRH
jgi:hypothetical protein